MPDEVVQTPFGAFLIPRGDLIGETLRAGTLWDGPGFLQPIAREYGRLGEPGTTILDIGANLGAFSVWLATQGAWRVLAVEPVPETMRYLKANLDLNKDCCAGTVIPLGVAAYDRFTMLAVGVLDPGNLGGTSLTPERDAAANAEVLVVAAPLDTARFMFGQRVSLIKVDAQGCDGAAIMGLQQTIRRDHPAVVFEWEPDLVGRHGHQLDDVRGFLHAVGYEVHEWPSQPNNYLAVWKGRVAS
jgi:FkbM family methyltransferase